jgi:hypothetical protein
MFPTSEDWISSFKIDWSGNDFMKILYDCGKLFWYCRIQGTNENISIFQTYVSWSSLVVWCEGNAEHEFGCSYERYVSYFKLLSLQCQLQHTHTHNFATFPCWQQNMANSFTKDYQPTYCHMGSRVQVFCNHVSTLLETKKKRAASSDYLFQQHPRIQQESFRSR